MDEEKEVHRTNFNPPKYKFLLTIKKAVFGFNFFLWATGCVAACIGIWLRIDRNMSTLVSRIEVSTITLNADKVYFGTYVMISVGVALTFIGLIGVFGSIRENEYALWLYSFLLLVTTVLYLIVAGWGIYTLDFLKGIVSDALSELFTKAITEFDQQAKYAVNEIQKQLQCCGNVGPSEYSNDIPPSCSSYIIGCNQAFADYYRRFNLIVSLVSLVFGITQFFGIGISVYFANEVRKARAIVNKSL